MKKEYTYQEIRKWFNEHKTILVLFTCIFWNLVILITSWESGMLAIRIFIKHSYLIIFR